MKSPLLKSLLTGVAGALLGMTAITGEAGLLNIGGGFPDITASGFSMLSYDATSDTLTVANPTSILGSVVGAIVSSAFVNANLSDPFGSDFTLVSGLGTPLSDTFNAPTPTPLALMLLGGLGLLLSQRRARRGRQAA